MEASKDAVQTATLIPPAIRGKNEDLGSIILATDEKWLVPDPDTVRLSGGVSEGVFVHERLESDPETLKALYELGIKLCYSGDQIQRSCGNPLGATKRVLV